MTTISNAKNNFTITVPFHGTNLFVINHNGEPYTPMKPIVEGMGMDWMGQYTKLKNRFSKGIEEISIPTTGGNQTMICLALRKLAGWLNTISPNKVKPEIRANVIRYQEECDDVLYEYWTKGEVTKKTKTRQCTAKQLTPLRQTAERLITTGLGKIYPDIWKLVHQHFEVDHIHQLTPPQVTEAVEYLNALEGEYLGKQQLPEVSELSIHFPITWWNQHEYILRANGCSDFSHTNPCRFPVKMLFGFNDNAPSAISALLFNLAKAGYDVSAARLEHLAHRHYAEIMYYKIEKINRDSSSILNKGTGFRISPSLEN